MQIVIAGTKNGRKPGNRKTDKLKLPKIETRFWRFRESPPKFTFTDGETLDKMTLGIFQLKVSSTAQPQA